jgi:hypothetical protein
MRAVVETEWQELAHKLPPPKRQALGDAWQHADPNIPIAERQQQRWRLADAD